MRGVARQAFIMIVACLCVVTLDGDVATTALLTILVTAVLEARKGVQRDKSASC